MLQKCEKCKNLLKFKNFISENWLQDSATDDIAYKQWIKDEGEKLAREKLTGSMSDILEKLGKKTSSLS